MNEMKKIRIMMYALSIENDLQTDPREDWLTYGIRPYTKQLLQLELQ